MEYGGEREILITVPLGKDKPVKIETSGFKGETCTKATAGLQAALGQTLVDNPTQDMYEPEVNVDHHLRQQNG
jgi:hypothetical protein